MATEVKYPFLKNNRFRKKKHISHDYLVGNYNLYDVHCFQCNDEDEMDHLRELNIDVNSHKSADTYLQTHKMVELAREWRRKHKDN